MTQKPLDEKLDALLAAGLAAVPEAEERILAKLAERLRNEARKRERFMIAPNYWILAAAVVALAATLGLFGLLLPRSMRVESGQSVDEDPKRTVIARPDDVTAKIKDATGEEKKEHEGALTRQEVSEIKISGNQRVTHAQILTLIKTRAGVKFDQAAWDEDWSRLADSGHFLNVKTSGASATPGGVVLTIDVVEHPLIESVRFMGMGLPPEQDARKAIRSVEGAVYTRGQAALDCKAIESLLRTRNRPGGKVTAETRTVSSYKTRFKGEEVERAERVELLYAVRMEADAPGVHDSCLPDSAYGEPGNGIRLGASMEKADAFAAGAPIRVSIGVRNVSTKAITLPHCGLWPRYLRIKVFGPGGEELQLRRAFAALFEVKEARKDTVADGGWTIQPGCAFDQLNCLDIASVYDLGKPGIYEINVAYVETEGMEWRGEAVARPVKFAISAKP